MVIELLVGGVVAAGTYLFAKKKRASTGQSAAAAAVTGTGSVLTMALVTAFWPVFVVAGAVAGGFYYAKRRNEPKALPPSAEI
jgi:hypothetical protein